MKEINHEIFGKIKFDYLWEGEKEVNFFGKSRLITQLSHLKKHQES